MNKMNKKIKDALIDVQNGMSLTVASQKHDVSRSTLTDQAKKQNIVSFYTENLRVIVSKKEEARRLRSSGLSFRKISQKLKITGPTIKNWCSDIIISEEDLKANYHRLVDKRHLALQYRKEGKSLNEIAKILSCAKSSVSLWTRDIKLNISVVKKLQERKTINKKQNSLTVCNITDEVKEKYKNSILEYRFKGYSYKDIANELNIDCKLVMTVDKNNEYSQKDLLAIRLKVNQNTQEKVKEKRKIGLAKPVGGFRKGAERSKSGYYKGIYSSSTYELCWIVYNLDMGKDVKRFDGFLECPDKKFKYYPDFIEENNHIIEIKGYESECVSRKTALAERLGYTVTLMKEKDLQHVFEYVDKTYNVNKNNRHTLYDNYKPKFIINCFGCQTNFEVFQLRKNHKNGSPSYCSISCCSEARKRKFNEAKQQTE